MSGTAEFVGGALPAALLGITSYANFAAMLAANPGLSLNPPSYLAANELQSDIAGKIIANYQAYTNGRPDVGKTNTRRIYLSNLSQAQIGTTSVTSGWQASLIDWYAQVTAIQAAITAFTD